MMGNVTKRVLYIVMLAVVYGSVLAPPALAQAESPRMPVEAAMREYNARYNTISKTDPYDDEEEGSWVSWPDSISPPCGCSSGGGLETYPATAKPENGFYGPMDDIEYAMRVVDAVIGAFYGAGPGGGSVLYTYFTNPDDSDYFEESDFKLTWLAGSPTWSGNSSDSGITAENVHEAFRTVYKYILMLQATHEGGAASFYATMDQVHHTHELSATPLVSRHVAYLVAWEGMADDWDLNKSAVSGLFPLVLLEGVSSETSGDWLATVNFTFVDTAVQILRSDITSALTAGSVSSNATLQIYLSLNGLLGEPGTVSNPISSDAPYYPAPVPVNADYHKWRSYAIPSGSADLISDKVIQWTGVPLVCPDTSSETFKYGWVGGGARFLLLDAPPFDTTPIKADDECKDTGGANASIEDGEAQLEIGLSNSETDQAAGTMVFTAEQPREDVADPSSLEVHFAQGFDDSGTTGERHVVDSPSGAYRQIMGGEVGGNVSYLVEISNKDTSGAQHFYTIEYYSTATWNGVAGEWDTGVGAPFRTVKIINNGSSNDGKTIRIEDTFESNPTEITQFEWDNTNEYWTLAEGLDSGTGDAIRREWQTESVSGNTRTVTQYISSENTANLVSKTELTYQMISGVEVMTSRRRVSDDNGASDEYASVEEWEYSVSPDSAAPRLSAYLDMRGGWVTYEYGSDGRVSRMIRQLEDDAYAPGDRDTLAENNLAVVYSYSDSLVAGTETVVVEKMETQVRGSVEGVGYTIHRPTPSDNTYYESWSVACVTTNPEAAAGSLGGFIEDILDGSDAGGHLVTRTWKYESGDDHSFLAHKTLRPDGQMTLYDRTPTGQTTMSSGFPNTGLTEIVYGTITTTQVDERGNMVWQKTERVTQDENAGNPFVIGYVSATATDAYGRPTTTSYFFGSEAYDEDDDGSGTAAYTTLTTYSCCGGGHIGSSTTRNGITTTYEYDVMGRRTLTKRSSGTTNGEIWLASILDAAGRATDSGIDGDKINGLVRADPDDLVTTTTYDLAGRMTSSEDPEGRKTYRTYRRVNADGTTFDIDTDTGVFYWETRSYGHDNTAPVSVTWTDSHGDTVLQALCSTSAAWPPAADAALTVHRRSVQVDQWVDLGGGDYEHQRLSYAYHNLGDVGDDWMSNLGDEGDDYLVVSKTQMDVLGRTFRQTDVMGNITEPIYESGTGRTIGTKAGIDTAAMHVVSRVFYRVFAPGNDADNPLGDWRPYATRVYSVRPGLDTAPLENEDMMHYAYVESTEDYTLSGGALETYTRWSRPSATGAPWSAQTSDEQGRTTTQTTYRNGSTTYALAQSTTTYYADDHATTYLRGQVQYSDVMEASGSGTMLSNSLRTEYFYDDAGRQVKTQTTGRGFTKVEFDAYGRVLRQVYASAEGTDTDVFGTDTFTDDIVLSETVNTYNRAGEVIQTTSYARAHDAPGTTTGLLSAAAADQSRVSYAAVWRDDNRRVTHQALYGTNGYAAFTRPGTPPEPDTSDDVLVTKTEYDDAGVAYLVTANDGTQTRIYTDDAGNRTHVVENYKAAGLTGGDPATPADRDPDVNRVTQYTYSYANTTSGGGQMVSVTAIDPDADGTLTDNQTTFYIHSGEVNSAKRGYIPVNGRPVAVLYPDAEEDGTDRNDVITDINNAAAGDFVYSTYYAAGDVKSVRDQREVTWTSVYTTAGQADYRHVSATGSWTAPTGSDLRYEYTYGDAGELLTATAFSVATGGAGNRTSEVAYAYDGFYNPTSETQDHEPTTADHEGQVQYAYDTTLAGGVYTDAYRLDTITYPNGREVELVYDGHNGIDAAIGRPNGLDEVIGGVSTAVTRYEYLGTSALVVKDYVGADVRLDLTDEAGEGTIANDGYDAALDRFGRATRHQWETYDGSGDADEELFHSTTGYDRAGNRLYERLHHAPGYSQAFGHDGFNRITTADRGPLVLDSGEVDLTSGSAEVEAFWLRTGREWHLDQLGNQTRVNTESIPTDPMDETINRVATANNAGNEITTRTHRAKDLTDETTNSFSSAASPDDSAIFTRFVNCTSTNLSINTTDGVLVVDTGSATAPALILTGEGTGPLPMSTRFRVPTNTTTGYVGLVIGYNEDDGSYYAILKNFTTGDGDWEVFHVHDADSSGTIDYTDSAEFEYLGQYDYGGTGSTPTWHPFTTRPISNAFNMSLPLPDLTAEGGHPYGICGLFIGVADTEFDYADWFVPDRAVPLSAAWENEGANRILDPTTANDGKLQLSGGTWHRSHLPVLLRGLRAQRFEVSFTMNRVGLDDTANMRFVFNYRDRNNYDYIRFNHQITRLAPYAYEVRNGEHHLTLTEGRKSDRVPHAPNAADTIYYRVVSDGVDVWVYAGEDQTELDSNHTGGLWCMRTTASTDRYGFADGHGQMGFMGGSYTTYVDNLTVKTDPDDDASFTDSTTFEETEIVEDFTLTSGKLVDTLTYDDAGNLTFDGYLRYVFDASNRLVAVYNAGVSAADPGSLIAEYRYGPSGRRIEKKVYTADGLDDEQHAYYHGWSNIETQNGSGYITSQVIWDNFAGQYIDSNAQTARNTNPGEDDDKGTAGIQDGLDTRHHLLQDHRFSTRALVSDTATVLERYEYTVYGEQTVMDANYAPIGASAYSITTGYTGQTLDPETGNWYFRARYYHSAMGRFISADPLGYVDGMSRHVGYFAMYELIDPYGSKVEILIISSYDDLETDSYIENVEDPGAILDPPEDLGGELRPGASAQIIARMSLAKAGLQKVLDYVMELTDEEFERSLDMPVAVVYWNDTPFGGTRQDYIELIEHELESRVNVLYRNTRGGEDFKDAVDAMLDRSSRPFMPTSGNIYPIYDQVVVVGHGSISGVFSLCRSRIPHEHINAVLQSRVNDAGKPLMLSSCYNNPEGLAESFRLEYGPYIAEAIEEPDYAAGCHRLRATQIRYSRVLIDSVENERSIPDEPYIRPQLEGE